jgi:hypothetical protein
MDLLKIANRAAEKRAFSLMPSMKTVKRVGGAAMSDAGFAGISTAMDIGKRFTGVAKSSISEGERLVGG